MYIEARTSGSRLQFSVSAIFPLIIAYRFVDEVKERSNLPAFLQPRHTNRTSHSQIRLMTVKATLCDSGDFRHDSRTAGGSWTCGNARSSIRLHSQSPSLLGEGKEDSWRKGRKVWHESLPADRCKRPAAIVSGLYRFCNLWSQTLLPPRGHGKTGTRRGEETRRSH